MSNCQNNYKFSEFPESPNHTILYRLNENSEPIANPTNFVHRWDDNHVRMPCCSLSFHPVDNNGEKSLISRWRLIEEHLGASVCNVYDIKKAILSYNPTFENQWNFNVLCQLFENELSTEYKRQFFSQTYPKMVKLALDLPILVTKPIPLLKSGKTHSISMSKLQIASLLANAFFCTFPRRNKCDSRTSEYANYPRINFSSLFNTFSDSRMAAERSKKEKLKCILNYFKRVTQENSPVGVVTFSRRVLTESLCVDWIESEKSFSNIQLTIVSNGDLFSPDIDSTKIDFANKRVGGGVLNYGCVQEEILFATQPELIVSCLLTESLGHRESLLVYGTEPFSKHRGYSNSFIFNGDFILDKSQYERDDFGRLKNTISMIDALNFCQRFNNNNNNQFTQSNIFRDLNKAYCGFRDNICDDVPLPRSISTGKWGCGAFGGNVQLKFIIQILACAESQKNIIFYTFDDADLASELTDMFQYLQKSQVSVGLLMRFVLDFDGSRREPKLFDHIKRCFINK